MNKEKLLEETRDFLSTALSRFRCGEPITFDSNYRTISEATVCGFIKATKALERPLVLDAPSHFGEEFGLWVAKGNPSSEVHVVNPEPKPFDDQLFNNVDSDRLFKFDEETDYDPRDPEGSINNLYRTNGFKNASFHAKEVTEKNLDELLDVYSGRQVVIHANRVTELAPMFAKAVGRHENAEIVLLPWLTEFDPDAYGDDPLVREIAEYIKENPEPTDEELAEGLDNQKGRLFLAMSQYLALKLADTADANVYRVNEHSFGFPYQHANFIVSTLEPKE